ncbi:MAG: aminotransferase class V-fold PLP-dependent enzyme [Chitinophagales bacterium]|nr:aminotransferase class V-fold PLP-dependent enzyme [Chitinophagaceae bacterium]MCB9063803.1 aminotransferase class V-fold PLP-dependent enzyme [Chitinophagales bacterium]
MPGTLSIDVTSIEEAYQEFLSEYPEYNTTLSLDELRANEFSRIDKNGHTYLDFVGSNLYPASLVKEHQEYLLNNVYGNPHSINPTSSLATKYCEQARNYVKKYFNDIDDEYVVVFTMNASGALKLVGESYPFNDDSYFLLTADNHNSVNGIREFVRNTKASFAYTDIDQDTLFIEQDKLNNVLSSVDKKNKLFAFPAQSNFSGVKHDLGLIDKAHEYGWDVLLDAAAFVPTGKLDLSVYKPEFVSVSFYKMFGYPTGIGCLMMKKTVLSKLKRPWFAGGTIAIASVKADDHYMADNEVGFEDGTINFLNIPAVEMGLKYLEGLGLKKIQDRVFSLARWTLNELLSLKHDSGVSLIHLLGTSDMSKRGATITFNVRSKDGEMVFYEDVEKDAMTMNISLRAGCFCNPGADEAASNLTIEALRPIFETGEKLSYARFIEQVKKFTRGAVRVSFGHISNFNDAYKFVSFIKTYLNR